MLLTMDADLMVFYFKTISTIPYVPISMRHLLNLLM